MLFSVSASPATARRHENEAIVRGLAAPAAQVHAQAVNEMGALWDAHFGNDGLSETDRMVIIADDRAVAAHEIALLRAALAASEAENADLRSQLDEANANAASDADALMTVLGVIEAELDAAPLFGPVTVEEELARR